MSVPIWNSVYLFFSSVNCVIWLFQPKWTEIYSSIDLNWCGTYDEIFFFAPHFCYWCCCCSLVFLPAHCFILCIWICTTIESTHYLSNRFSLIDVLYFTFVNNEKKLHFSCLPFLSTINYIIFGTKTRWIVNITIIEKLH